MPGNETEVNKKVIVIDEAGGKQIKEFVGLRTKLYSYKMTAEDYKKCKGVKRNIVKKNYNHYKEWEERLRKICVIRSHLHDICAVEVVLSVDDDKRVLMEDTSHTGITRFAYMIYSPDIKVVDGVVLPSIPLSNVQLIDAAKKLNISNFTGIFVRD